MIVKIIEISVCIVCVPILAVVFSRVLGLRERVVAEVGWVEAAKTWFTLECFFGLTALALFFLFISQVEELLNLLGI